MYIDKKELLLTFKLLRGIIINSIAGHFNEIEAESRIS